MGLSSTNRPRYSNEANCTNAHNGGVLTRSWSELPTELLSAIANCLGIIELLGFRATCKDWYSASSPASAQIMSSANQKPWFILCGPNSQCCLYDQLDNKKYTINIPGLDGASCLASNHGWLLLFRDGLMFFLCPFSGARIDLPQFPHPELSDHVGAFWSPPTSRKCIVCVINTKDESELELNMLSRDNVTWIKHQYRLNRHHLDAVKCATYDDGIFYFMDNKDQLLTFNIKDKRWQPYRIVDHPAVPTAGYLPFGCESNYFQNKGMMSLMELDEHVSVSICGTVLPTKQQHLVVYNENITASNESESHNLKGIWIHPRFFLVPPNQSWYLP